jgi:hypothetical protein
VWDGGERSTDRRNSVGYALTLAALGRYAWERSPVLGAAVVALFGVVAWHVWTNLQNPWERSIAFAGSGTRYSVHVGGAILVCLALHWLGYRA